jgi:hypothetical protein
VLRAISAKHPNRKTRTAQQQPHPLLFLVLTLLLLVMLPAVLEAVVAVVAVVAAAVEEAGCRLLFHSGKGLR